MQEQSPPPSIAVTLDLPPEFVRLCEIDGIDPTLMLRGFIADVCGITGWVLVPRADGYASHGSDEVRMAREYFWRAGLHCLQAQG